MAQATFEFNPLGDASSPGLAGGGRARNLIGAAGTGGADTTGLDRAGFEIGWDHAHHRLTPPLRHLDDRSPVRQGWTAGRTAFGERTLRSTAAVRQWLALRLQAWQGGQVFEAVQVNPSFLARIDTDTCPVSRCALTLGTGLASDATVTRLNPAAAYAAGNLAVLSRQVTTAQAAGDWEAALSQALRIEAGHATASAGLGADDWTRLAVLGSFATPLPHASAALLPLRVLPPNRVRVINPVQALQVMLTLQFSQPGYARRLLGLAALMPGSRTRQVFQIFMHTLLARRLALGAAPSAPCIRQAMEDSWADALINRRWQRLALGLTAADCEQLLQRASQRELVVGGGRWLSSEAATEGWALGDGRRPRQDSAATGAARQAVVGSGTSPGSTRSLGSQKLAS